MPSSFFLYILTIYTAGVVSSLILCAIVVLTDEDDVYVRDVVDIIRYSLTSWIMFFGLLFFIIPSINRVIDRKMSFNIKKRINNIMNIKLR